MKNALLRSLLVACALLRIALDVGAQTPDFSWAKRVASTTKDNDEFAIGLAMDSAANLFVTGWFDGTNDFGGVTLTNSSFGQDIFVARYSPSGALQWVRKGGGTNSSGWNVGRGAGVDCSGNVYVTGGYLGTVNFDGVVVTNAPFQNQEFFLAKYDNNGALQWVRNSGGGGHSAYGTGIAVDGSGNTYSVGYFDGGTVKFGATVLTNFGEYNAFLVKYNSSGTFQWARALQSTYQSYSVGVALDGSGAAYVAAGFVGPTIQLGATIVTNTGGRDGLIAKYDSGGTLQWARGITGASDAGAEGIALDSATNVFVVGGIGSTNGDITTFGPSVTLTNGGGGVPGSGIGDAYLAKFNSAGVAQWARRAGTTNLDAFLGVGSDSAGNVYASGAIGGGSGTNHFRVIASKYDGNGLLQWTQSSSGTNATEAISVAGPLVDPVGNCYIAGWFRSNVVFGTNVLNTRGVWDFFLTKVGTAPPVGSLQVTISPAGAVSAGAQWQVDGGAWQNSGVTVTGLTAGAHTVAYKSIANWDAPGNQNVIINPFQTTMTNGVYLQHTGSLQVTISPAGAVSAGAQWQVDGGAWQNSGAVVNGLVVGNHTVSYKVVAGWIVPSNQLVGITVNTTTITNGIYGLSDFLFTTNAGAVTITGYTGSSLQLVIPSTINGLPVTQIGTSAFGGFPVGSPITSVVIPNSVTTIGDYAFKGCQNLTNVVFGNSLVQIGEAAFDFCFNLRSVILPNTVTTIGNYAFYACNLTNLSLGTNLVSIGIEAFRGAAITTLTLPRSLTSLGNSAFQECTSLKSVAFLDCTTAIGASAFESCSSLRSVALGTNLTAIGTAAFKGCGNLAGLVIPASVASIGDYAFQDCYALSGLYFRGNAPGLGGASVFLGAFNSTIYYLPSKSGWGPVYGDRPASPWMPQLGIAPGPSSALWQLSVDWVAGETLVMYVSTNLATTNWSMVLSNPVPADVSFFFLPSPVGSPRGFYRSRIP